MNVEKFLDELWIGVKGQSNSEISCSPRNNFRVSPGRICEGVEHWIHAGGPPPYQRKPNSEYFTVSPGDRQWGISFIVKRGTAQTAG